MGLIATTFDGQTLNDDTTYFHQSTDYSGEIVIPSIIFDIDGNAYDTSGTGDNNTRPGTMTVNLVVKAATDTAFDTAVSNIRGLSATEGTLTVTNAQGGTETATARCTAVPVTTEEVSHTAFIQTFTLTFALKTGLS